MTSGTADLEPPRKIPARSLGRDGPEISVVGLGSWAMGGTGWSDGWGPQEDKESMAAIRHAIEMGVNWIDTAAVYGLGHSEELVGRVVRGIPPDERPYVFTKCGSAWDPERPMDPPRDGVLEPDSIRRECEASLRRLGLDHIDLYQFHFPDLAGWPVEDSWAEMLRLQKEGKVRWVGVSNFHPDLLERLESVHHVDSLQNPFSLLDRAAALEDLRWCLNHGTGFLCYSPLQNGLLTEAFSLHRASQLAGDDWRRRHVSFQPPLLNRALHLRDELRPIAGRNDTNVASVALAWVLAWQGTSAAIVGARSAAQVDDWIGAGELHLSVVDLKEIAAAIRSSGAGSGPDCPNQLRKERAE